MNQSFLYEGHQLQIPKRQVQYEDLRKLDLDHRDIAVVLPHGERFKGWLYHQYADNIHSEYYQLHLYGRQAKFPDYLKLSDEFIVVMFKSRGRSFMLIERWE